MMTVSRSKNAPSRWLVVTAFAAIYLIWGSTYLGIRFAIETLPPFFMAGVRFVLAGVALFLWMRWRGAPPPGRAHWRSAALIGGMMILGGVGVVTWAEQRIPSGLAALLIAVMPIWIVLLEWLGPEGVRPGGKVLAGLALGMAGMALLIGPGDLGDGNPVDLIGAGAVLLAAFSWANGSLYSRRAALPDSPLLATGMEMFVGGLLLLTLALLTGEGAQVDLSAVSLRSLLALGYLIVMGSLVAFTAYIWLLKVTTPSRVATYAYVNPVVAIFVGWALAGEPLTPRVIAATAVIVAAVMLITTWRSQRQVEATP
jgi:drug/metabolite transporter (DMT)-like permease